MNNSNNGKMKSLRSAINDSLNQVWAVASQIPWKDRQAYAQWLAQTYYFVNHTTVLLAMSAAKHGVAPSRKDHEEVLKHLRQETGHEKLALNDIKALGCDITDFPEYLETAVFYQAQYYWIDRFGPLAYTGYVLLLEGLAAKHAKTIVQMVEPEFGKTAISFLKVHLEVDDDHFDEGLKRLAMAPTEVVEMILKNLEQSQLLYQNILRAIIAQSEVKNQTKTSKLRLVG